MKPMEDSQFIGQMAQFSSLEQMQNLNKTMEAQAHFQNLSSACGLIGKTVTLVDKDLGNVSGKVTEVRQKDDKLNVVIDGKEFDSTTITGVAAPAAAAAASGTTPTGT
jgi:flagellar basal-body rod modification protein FlgD